MVYKAIINDYPSLTKLLNYNLQNLKQIWKMRKIFLRPLKFRITLSRKCKMEKKSNLTFSETKHVSVMSVCKTGSEIKTSPDSCLPYYIVCIISRYFFSLSKKFLHAFYTITEIDIKSQYLSCRRAVNKSSPGRYYTRPAKFSSSCLLTQKIAD